MHEGPNNAVAPNQDPRERLEAGIAESPEYPSGYRLIRKLGGGAIGTVWEAIRERDGKRVALKCPHSIFGGFGTVTASLKRELEVARLLDHPNIVKILNFHDSQGGGGLIEMEYVEGSTLADHVFQSPHGILSWEKVAPLARQLAEALIHSHGKGIVHRDIKPANLILTDQGVVKLADFGSASMIDAAVTMITISDSGLGLGTLAFMSPQQLNGHAPSPSDDIYALGATLYSLLTGRPPFHFGHVVHQILSRRPISIPQRLREAGVINPVPPAVNRLILDCLSKSPKHRPKSAHELLERLEECASGDHGRRRFLKLAPAIGIGVATAALFNRGATPEFSLEDDFESIFNGTTLDGWTAKGEAWRVEDGCIIAEIDGRRTLDASEWKRVFLDLNQSNLVDFELRLEVRLEIPTADAGNLGVRYRIDHDPSGEPSACQMDFEPNWKYNGGLRRYPQRDIMARPGQIAYLQEGERQPQITVKGLLADQEQLTRAYRHEEWNRIAISAHGGSLVHWLNGTKIIEYHDTMPQRSNSAGGIGLTAFLYYGPSVKAAFRNLRIRRTPVT